VGPCDHTSIRKVQRGDELPVTLGAIGSPDGLGAECPDVGGRTDTGHFRGPAFSNRQGDQIGTVDIEGALQNGFNFCKAANPEPYLLT